MNIKEYEVGKIKVVWIEEEAEMIYSKMFENISDAEKFAENKINFLIFKLISQKNMTEFSWQLLPYGRYKLYKTLINLSDKYLTQILEKL